MDKTRLRPAKRWKIGACYFNIFTEILLYRNIPDQAAALDGAMFWAEREHRTLAGREEADSLLTRLILGAQTTVKVDGQCFPEVKLLMWRCWLSVPDGCSARQKWITFLLTLSFFQSHCYYLGGCNDVRAEAVTRTPYRRGHNACKHGGRDYWTTWVTITYF